MVVAVFEDLEQVADLLTGHRVHEEVIEDEDVDAREFAEEAGHRVRCPGERKLLEEPRDSGEECTGAGPASRVSESRAEVGLSDTGFADNDDIVMLADPGAGGELPDEGLGDTPLWGAVDIVERGAVSELGLFDAAGRATIVAVMDDNYFCRPTTTIFAG